MDRIIGLLTRPAQLITLVGPGGIGKTRLATEALRRYRKKKGVSVFWVRLARLTKGSSSTAVEEEIANTIAGPDLSGRSGWDALVDKLTTASAAGRDPPAVLVMDNCEHVLESAGQVIAELLETIPRLTVLATSRAPVGWADEYVVAVPSLPRRQALMLFRQRARFTGSDIDKEDLAKAALICRHVHCNPLYIRLAAARLLRQPLATIVDDLSGEATDKRLRWRHGPRVGAEPRHQGVRDVIAWSYDLCLDQERLLLDRMSVFAAGYDAGPDDDATTATGVDLEAIRAVCADLPRGVADRPDNSGQEPAPLTPEDLDDALERLVDQSLVTAHLTPTTVRYSLLETVRVFAAGQLQERSTQATNEPARFARRHRAYYRDKIVGVQRGWFGPGERDLMAWVRGAWDNLVKAIETSLTDDEPTSGLEIAIRVSDLRTIKGSPREMRRWTMRTLEAARRGTSRATDLHIQAMAVIGWLDLIQGKDAEAEQMLEECVGTLHDSRIGVDWRQAPASDVGLPARVEFLWGAELMMLHKDPVAVTVFARAREKFRAVDDRAGVARSSELEAWAACFVGSSQQALSITHRHLQYTAASGAGWAVAWAQLPRAMALIRNGATAESLDLSRNALSFLLEVDDLFGETWAVRIRMWALAQATSDILASGNADNDRLRATATEAAQLAGGITRLRALLGFEQGGLGPFPENEALEVVRRTLGRERFDAAQRAGSLLRPEAREVQRLALGTLSMERLPIEHPARQKGPARWSELSIAEQEVAILAAVGWTNADIAARRGTSTKTIDAQMAAIFRKLVITSRYDIIEVAPRDELERMRTTAGKRTPRAAGKRSGTRLR